MSLDYFFLLLLASEIWDSASQSKSGPSSALTLESPVRYGGGAQPGLRRWSGGSDASQPEVLVAALRRGYLSFLQSQFLIEVGMTSTSSPGSDDGISQHL